MGKNKKKKTQKQWHKKFDNASDAWEVEIDCVKDCSKAPEEIIVWMKPLVKEQIEVLMKEYKSIEWLAYLVGEWTDDKTPIVKELFIPEQKVSGVSVDNIKCPEHNDLGIIGVIHSHHNMSHSFSQIDADWINQNHNISLVVSHTGMDGQVRWKTPCGSLITVKSKTKLWYDVNFDKDDFIKKAKEKINNEPVGYNLPGISNFNRYNYAQQSYLNGNSVKPESIKTESNEPDVDDINNNKEVEEETWETSIIEEDETLKDALLAYEKRITPNEEKDDS